MYVFSSPRSEGCPHHGRTVWLHLSMSSVILIDFQSCCLRGHHLEVLALALALKKRSWSWPWPWIEAKAKTFLKLEKSPEHFQIIDADFVWCYRTMCVQQQMSARLLIIFTSPLSACHSQQVRTLKNHDKLKSHKSWQQLIFKLELKVVKLIHCTQC